ncbi:hypothetical protein DNX69_09270 [Rhodopseudomonas palustris]|uniref:Aerobactin siderophore biosynthesis IucA/IucC N-terminal domain-containing protein n=1 Tax=Rhodopseudomonas palustris TaxID=1076 RepID=A0A323UIJ2_RHOPL|nr:IucA/IucC family protein [Rhodopseudomonas palustris]PZA12189.1 hypothetical protein DNX69_09270 [Rhodopseudomonas palustris]
MIEDKLSGLHPTLESFIKLERYLNDGSPSGFSEINTTSPGHRPSDPVPCFDLSLYSADQVNLHRAGSDSKIENQLYPVHPDMTASFEEMTGLKACHKAKAIPTSSPRTLYVDQPNDPLFVKLAYQRLIGRVTRRMTRRHVMSAIEISRCLKDAIDRRLLPPQIQIFHEYAGAYFDDDSDLTDWGFVERQARVEAVQQFPLIPAFSLFATAHGSKIPLLHAIMERSTDLRNPECFFVSYIRPLLDLYFEIIIVLGLQPEAHSQNVIYALGSNLIPAAVALRDMESVDKDLGIMDHFRMSPSFTELTYKTLRKSDYNYQIMHSFMFDFKLGEYLIRPLTDCWAKLAGERATAVIEGRIRGYSQDKMKRLPDDFFPKGVWFDYEPVVHEGSQIRQYRSNSAPRFR